MYDHSFNTFRPINGFLPEKEEESLTNQMRIDVFDFYNALLSLLHKMSN